MSSVLESQPLRCSFSTRQLSSHTSQPSASRAFVPDRRSATPCLSLGVAEALSHGSAGAPVDLRLFGKPEAFERRRMGVALARGDTSDPGAGEAIRRVADAALGLAL